MVYASNDSGETWTQNDITGDAAGEYYNVTCDTTGQNAYATVRNTTTPETITVYKSTNYGSTWSPITSFTDTGSVLPETIASSSDCKVILIGTSLDIWASVNYGETFRRLDGSDGSWWGLSSASSNGSLFTGCIYNGKAYNIAINLV